MQFYEVKASNSGHWLTLCIKAWNDEEAREKAFPILDAQTEKEWGMYEQLGCKPPNGPTYEDFVYVVDYVIPSDLFLNDSGPNG